MTFCFKISKRNGILLRILLMIKIIVRVATSHVGNLLAHDSAGKGTNFGGY
jgi:hypothetical protein